MTDAVSFPPPPLASVGPPPAARCVLVVPCFNEAARLDPAAFQELVDRDPDVAVLFVDDGSKDDTGRVLAALAESRPGRLAVMTMPQNVGKGEAVRRGLSAAIGSDAAYVGYWDADLATPLDEVDDFIRLLDRDRDIDAVVGARVKLLGHEIVRRPLRHYAGRAFAAAAAAVLGLPMYDTQCGAKVFRVGPVSADALAEPFASRWIFDVELLGRIAARRPDHPYGGVVERPLGRWVDVAGSKVGLKAVLGAAFGLWRTARALAAYRETAAVGRPDAVVEPVRNRAA
ncbi:MAG: glycosyltransferase [Planctomycetota bacterium]